MIRTGTFFKILTISACGLTMHAGSFQNGGFETINHSPIASGTAVAVNPGDTWLTGWSVGGPGGGAVQVQNGVGEAGALSPEDGQQYILFNAGNSAPGGSLSQTFTTTAGEMYVVSFAVARTGTGNVSLTATAMASDNTVIGSNYCAPSTSGVWTFYQLAFTAVTTNTTLTFLDTSATTVAVDIELDAVTLTPQGTAGIPNCDPPPSGLVSWWPFEGNLNDLAGSNNGALAAGGPVNYLSGIVGRALQFPGGVAAPQGATINFGTAVGNFGTNDFTIDYWMNTVDTHAQQAFLGKRSACDGATSFWEIRMGEPVGHPYLYLDNGGNVAGIYLLASHALNDGLWHHLAWVRQNTNLTLYVDGALDGRISDGTVYNLTNNVPLILGTSVCQPANDGTYPYDGSVDELDLFNRALAADEIAAIYNAGSAGKCPLSPCLPHPATATLVMAGGFVVAATITDSGCGYTNAPLVLIQGGGGMGAGAVAVLSNGAVASIVITNAGIGYTNPASIVIGFPPSIVAEPQSVTVNAYGTASFRVSAMGPTSLDYQWLFDGTNILGATSNVLTITNVVQTNLGVYSVIVTNAFAAVTSSNAFLSMNPFLVAPFRGLDTFWGYTNVLSVGAWGTGPFSYQWFNNGVAIANATNATLSFSGIQFANAGLYTVVVTSPLGSVTNTPEQVIVNPAGVSLGLYPGVTINGVVGYDYVIQRTSDLSNSNAWVTVANVTLTQPLQIWVDTNINTVQPSNQQQYYRVLPGQ